MLCGAHVLIMLTNYIWYSLNLCVYFLCLQCGRSKRKSFWNDGEETVLQEYPIGTGSSSKRGEAPSFSCTQGERQVSHQKSTLLTCEQSVREIPQSLSQPRPFQKTRYTSNVSSSCTIPQPPLIQPSHVTGSMPTQQPKIFCHNSCSFTWYWRCLCVINSHLFCNSTCWYVFDSFTLWCGLECHFVWSLCKEHFLDWAFSCGFVLNSVEKGKCVGSLGSSCCAVYITDT